MTTLLDIPPEILEQVLLELDPVNVAAISQACIFFSELIYGPASDVFWSRLYLSMALDDPRQCLDPLGNPLKDVHWRSSLQRIIRARSVAKNPSVCREGESIEVWQTLLGLAMNTLPMYSVASDDLSFNLVWLGSLLRDGAWLEHAVDEPSEEERQLRAHFHTLYGLTRQDFDPLRRIDTRCTVYALRNYTAQNMYGPFVRDDSGTVDWELVQAIQHVISMHIVPNRRMEDMPSNAYIGSPMSLPFCSSVLESDFDLDGTEDWAGVEGTWQCSFCFCDHRDLLVFNNYSVQNGPLRRDIFEDPEFTEAFTVYEFNLRVTSSEPDEKHPKRPLIKFVGSSQDNQAEMEGWVRLTPDNCIQWHFVSNGMWSSEGVQVGNIRSTFGVLGIWTTIHHERSDPVGPFWLRKILDS